MYTICKSFEFSAAHSLPHLHDGHRCRNVHGHTYTVQVLLRASVLAPSGMVRDFGELSELKTYISQRMDHANLNTLIENPTAENLAKHLYDVCVAKWPDTQAVRVWESPRSWAQYSR